MKKQSKNFLPLILFLIILSALICGVLYYYLTGQPSSTTVEKMKTALISHSLQPVDITDSALEKFPNAGLNNCIVADQDDIRFEFYNFDNTSSAMEVYRQAHSLIITTRLANPRTEISYGKVNYQVYTLAADGTYSVAIYVGNTAIYAYCNAENEPKINSVLDSIGYIDAVPDHESPSWLTAVLRLLQFVLYIPMALIGRHWLWRAAYKSAGVTSKQLNDSEKNKKELSNWFIEISSREKTTKTILGFYKLCLLPEYICVILAIAGCFTTQMNSLLNTVGVVIPCIIFATGIVGAVIDKNLTLKNN